LEVQVTPSSAQMVLQPGPRRWLMLIVVLCAALVVVLDGFIVNVAIPSIERELHASFAELQLVVAGYTLAYAVLLVTGGRLGDLYGRKRLFVLGMGGFTLFSACCGIAPNALLLIIFRIAQGAAAALMFPQMVSFVISVLVITLLSPGLSLFVLPLAGSLPPRTGSESVAPEQKEGTKHVHQK
jgi:MFS family permease